MDGRKQQVPSSGLQVVIQPEVLTATEVLLLDTSRCMKGLVKELVGLLGDERILRP